MAEQVRLRSGVTGATTGTVTGRSTPRQKPNSGANRLPPEDRLVHQWYRFVLSFPPHLVRDYVKRFELGPTHRVLDPFCGAGTTLVECKKLGIPSVGIEAHPMEHFASQVKADWSPAPDGLVEHATKVADAALARLSREGIHDELFHPHGSVNLRALRKLPPESARLFLANSISPLPLHKTLVLLDCLQWRRDARYDHHELPVLAKAVVFSISNLHFGPEVGVAPPKADAMVVHTWLSEVHAVAADLRIVRGLPSAAARSLASIGSPAAVQAIKEAQNDRAFGVREDVRAILRSLAERAPTGVSQKTNRKKQASKERSRR